MPRDRDPSVYYILEHPRKGMCVGTGQNAPGDRPWPRFSWFTPRNGKKVVRWRTLNDVLRYIEELGKTDWPAKGRLRIRKAPRFHYRCWECGGWIDDHVLPYERGHKRHCPLIED